jgi:hypothetical protein
VYHGSPPCDILVPVITIRHLTLNVYVGSSEEANRIEKKLDELLKGQQKVMTDLTQITQEVQNTSDAEDAAVLLLTNLHDLLVAAGTDQTKLNDLATALRTKKDALAAAIVANTPTTPVP